MDPSSSTQKCVYVSSLGENLTQWDIDNLLKNNKKWPYKPNSSYPHHDSPLLHACRTQQKEITLFFLEKMESSKPKVNEDKESIVHLACHSGDIDIIKKMLERLRKSKGLDSQNREGMTPLAILASKVDLIGLQTLIVSLPKVKLDPTVTQNPLSIAIERKDERMIQALLETHNFDSGSKSTTYKIVDAALSYYDSSILNLCLDLGLKWQHLLKNHEFIFHDIVKWRDLELIKRVYAIFEKDENPLLLNTLFNSCVDKNILMILCRELEKAPGVTPQDKEVISFFIDKGIRPAEQTWLSVIIQTGQNPFLRKLFLEEPFCNYVDPLPTLSEADHQVILQDQQTNRG